MFAAVLNTPFNCYSKTTKLYLLGRELLDKHPTIFFLRQQDMSSRQMWVFEALAIASKNPFYKNRVAQNRQKIKNILRIMLKPKVTNLIRI